MGIRPLLVQFRNTRERFEKDGNYNVVTSGIPVVEEYFTDLLAYEIIAKRGGERRAYVRDAILEEKKNLEKRYTVLILRFCYGEAELKALRYANIDEAEEEYQDYSTRLSIPEFH